MNVQEAYAHSLSSSIEDTLGISTMPPYVKNILSMFVLSAVGYAVTKSSEILSYLQMMFHKLCNQKTKQYLRTPLINEPKYSTISFQAVYRFSTEDLYATPSFRAWVSYLQKNMFDENCKSLINFRECSDLSDAKDIDTTDLKMFEFQTPFIPDTDDYFNIQDDILCSFQTSSSDTDNEEKDKYYYIKLRSKNKNALVELHDRVVKAYLEKKASSLITQSYIYKLTPDPRTNKVQWSKEAYSSTRKIHNLWFHEKPEFMRSYNRFLTQKKDYYDKRGEPYTFSAMLYGEPGCGKTSLIKSLVSYDREVLDRVSHIFLVSLADIHTTDMLYEILYSTNIDGVQIPNDRRIIVFEDFDAGKHSRMYNILRDRNDTEREDDNNKDIWKLLDTIAQNRRDAMLQQNIEVFKMRYENIMRMDNTSDLSLAALLNMLDGINERSGQRIFWTTNIAEPRNIFDSAFLRPGRIDMMINFRKSTLEGVAFFAKQHFEEEYLNTPVPIELDGKLRPCMIKQILKESESESDAYVSMLRYCNAEFDGETAKSKVIETTKRALDGADDSEMNLDTVTDITQLFKVEDPPSSDSEISDLTLDKNIDEAVGYVPPSEYVGYDGDFGPSF